MPISEGAWISVLLVPGVVFLCLRVRRHYDRIAQEISWLKPLDRTNFQPPVVVVPVGDWNIVSQRAIRFALRLSPVVMVTHVITGERPADSIQDKWEEYVEEPAKRANLRAPCLITLPSPCRRLFTPLLEYINGLNERYPDRLIAVVIPELVETRWYHYILHNHHAAILKAALLLKRDDRVIAINVPWFLGE